MDKMDGQHCDQPLLQKVTHIFLHVSVKDNADGMIAVEAELLTVQRWANISTLQHNTHREVRVCHRTKDDCVAKTERVHQNDVHSVEASKGMKDEVGRPVLSRYDMLSDRLLRPTITSA
eukprot:6205162-Pleurochrysis_carterae.AAC.1